MKLARVRIQNFRCYLDPVQIEIEDLSALIGSNDAGKSSVLDALNLFFNDKEAKLEPDDAHVLDDTKRISITCEFDELDDDLVIDAQHPTTLREEHLLNKSGRLEITRTYDASIQKPSQKQVYITAIHPRTEGAHDLLQRKNTQLKLRAKELGVLDKVANQSINASLRSAIREAFPELDPGPIQLDISEMEKGSGKDIWQRLQRAIPAYFLFKADRPSTDQDAEAQDPLKAAVRAALNTLDAELAAIAERVSDQATAVANSTLDKLRDLDSTLAEQITPRFSRPNWHTAFKISLEDELGISINKRGSGVRRLVLLSFLQAEAEKKAEDSGRNIIYAIEEPETSLHPDMQRQLYFAISRLSKRTGTQVLLTTHTPELGGLLPIEAIQFIDIDHRGTRHIHSGDKALHKASSALGVLRSDSVKLFVGVEGPTDIEFFKAISRVLCETDQDVPDLEQLEANREVIFIPFGGSNLKHWVHRLAPLKIPEIHIADRDVKPPEVSPSQKAIDQLNQRENCEAYLTSKREIENYLHPDAISAGLGILVSFDEFDDVPELVENEVRRRQRKDIGDIKQALNTLAARSMTPMMLDSQDCDGDVRMWLSRVSEMLARVM